MKNSMYALIAGTALSFSFSAARAEPEPVRTQNGVTLFRHAGESGWFFGHSYGYAIFPTIGEGGFVVGAAGGKGQVFIRGQQVGETTLAEGSVGFQAGGQAFREIIF